MKKNRIFFCMFIAIAGIFAVACSGTAPGSWPGLTANQDSTFVSNNSFIYAIHTSDGTLSWKFPAAAVSGQSFFAAPILSPDGTQLIAGNFETTLYSLDPTNGNQKWSFTGAKGRWIGPVLITADTIYAPSSDDNLYALDLQGVLKWVFNTRGAIWSQPVTDGKTIYLTSMDHYLYAIQPLDGKKIWAIDLGTAIVSAPLLDQNGNLYVGTLGNEVLAVQASDGKILWRTTTLSSIWSSPVLQNSILYLSDLTGQIYAISGDKGAILWQHKVSGLVIGSPIFTSKGLVVGDETGNLTALDLNGNSLWSKAFNGKLYTSPVYQSSLILVTISSSSDNLVVALDVDGNQKWAFIPPK
jgi:outer membrane protein assembly factor BamB